MRRRRFLTCPAVFAGAGLVPTRVLARRLFPDQVTDRYVAWEGERAVGRQEISFERESGRFVVHVATEFRFAAPGSGDVSYSHESREVWDTGWLHALTSTTRVDGHVRTVRARRSDGALMIDGSDVRPFQMSSYVVTSSLWHRDSRLADAFLDVENGSVILVRPRYVGKETLQQGGGVVEAHRYSIRGELNRESWYDADCVLVRWDLPVTGGGWVSFRREMSQ